jgi:glutaredoxin
MSTAAVTLYTRVRCHLCDVVKETLEQVRRDRPFDLTIIDVDTDRELVRLYDDQVPVVMINGRKAFKYRVDPAALRARLDRAEAGEPFPEDPA